MSEPCCMADAHGIACDCRRPFVTGAKVETQQRDWNALRVAIRNRADHEEIERLWDRCERWVVTIPARVAETCECGMSGPCMSEECKAPVLAALRKIEGGEG